MESVPKKVSIATTSAEGREPAALRGSLHSGQGALTGGGVKRIYKRPDARECVGKVERRLGPVMLFCLATLATILGVYGLFDAVIHDDVKQVVQGLKVAIESLPKDERMLKPETTVENSTFAQTRTKRDENETTASSLFASSLPPLDSSSSSAATTSSENNASSAATPTTTTTPPPPSQQQQSHESVAAETSVSSDARDGLSSTAITESGGVASTATTTTTTTTTTKAPIDAEQNASATTTVEAAPSTTPTTPPATTTTLKLELPTTTATTSPTTSGVVPQQQTGAAAAAAAKTDEAVAADALLERLYQLHTIMQRFAEVHAGIWALFWVNIVALLILVPFVWAFHARRSLRESSTAFRLVYRIVLMLYELFFLIELWKLISPLLVDTLYFPAAMDALFSPPTTLAPPNTGYPNFFARPVPSSVQPALLKPIEDRFACVFESQELLVRMGLQERCLPKLKNYLLPVYTVFMLILVALTPMLFPVFTYVWMGWLKSWGFVWALRRRFDENQTRLQQQQQRAISFGSTTAKYY